ncbi:hypothetical protein NN561_012781 [Cricetulus griseus]
MMAGQWGPHAGHWACAHAAAGRPLLPQPRNPSAQGRALILITLRPLAAGVTSVTRALSSSFQNRPLLLSPQSHLAGSAAMGPAPPGAAVPTAPAPEGKTNHASAEPCRKCSRLLLPLPYPRAFKRRALQEGDTGGGSWAADAQAEVVFLAETAVGVESSEGNVG